MSVFGKTHKEGKNRRGNITQSAGLIFFLIIFRKGVLLGISGHNERNGVCCMRSVRVSCLMVNHLLSVTVIGSDEQDVSGLLASFIDFADGLIGGRDGLDSRIQDTSMANLTSIFVNSVSQMW